MKIEPQHLLGIESLSKEQILAYLRDAETFVEVSERDIKKVPSLRGKTVINLFMEASTRTRASFEIAGKRLSADTINITASTSSTTKGETLLDTARTLQAMNPDVLVIRHSESGSPLFLSRYLKNTAIVNAGDGLHEHPSQALLDLLSIRQKLVAQGQIERAMNLSRLRIAIVGDVRHSRVARSNIWAHLKLGNEVRLVGPPTLVPTEFEGLQAFGKGVSVHHSLVEGVEGADVVICLRMQLERMSGHFVPSLEEYTNEFFVSEALLQRNAPNAMVMHPGPINRGVEVESRLIDGPRSLVERQVNNGVAIRMAILLRAAMSVSSARDEKLLGETGV
jgi:aspartate carbamoyltransferase catalytic subunit